MKIITIILSIINIIIYLGEILFLATTFSSQNDNWAYYIALMITLPFHLTLILLGIITFIRLFLKNKKQVIKFIPKLTLINVTLVLIICMLILMF